MEPIKWTDQATAIAAIATALITGLLVVVGSLQLRKILEANNLQALEALYNQYMSPSFVVKRKRLASLILNFEYEDKKGILALQTFFSNEKDREASGAQLSVIKNQFEDVIYLFQKIGYYSLKKHLFSIDDVYILFSYEILRYWILVEGYIGYVSFLRYNSVNGENDFYKSFEAIFYKMVIQQIVSQKAVDPMDMECYKTYSIRETRLNVVFANEIERLSAPAIINEFVLEECNLFE